MQFSGSFLNIRWLCQTHHGCVSSFHVSSGTTQASETPRFPSEDKTKPRQHPVTLHHQEPDRHHCIIRVCLSLRENKGTALKRSSVETVNPLSVRIMIDQALVLESSLCCCENVSFKLNHDDDGPKIKATWVFKRHVWFCGSRCRRVSDLLSVTRCRPAQRWPSWRWQRSQLQTVPWWSRTFRAVPGRLNQH